MRNGEPFVGVKLLKPKRNTTFFGNQQSLYRLKEMKLSYKLIGNMIIEKGVNSTGKPTKRRSFIFHSSQLVMASVSLK